MADADEMQLLKERHSQHAAARAWQREAEGDAAAKAAVEAKAAAAKARKLETQAIEKEAAEKRAAEAKKEARPSGGGTVEFTGPIPASCDEFSGNRATGCALMLKAGFEIDQFPCLDKLWTKESGWNHRASNPSSGAYGIPQALPGSKMGSVGRRLEDQPGHPDQVGPRLHRGPVRHAVQCLVALAEHRLVLIGRTDRSAKRGTRSARTPLPCGRR